MKCLLVICCLLVASASASYRFDDELREAMEYVRLQMQCGFPSLGVPRLAPYTKDFHQFDLNDQGLNFSGDLTDLIVTGLDSYQFTQLTYSIVDMHLKYDMAFEDIQILSKYTARGELGALGLPMQLFGAGDFGLQLKQLRFNGSFSLRPTTSNGLKIWRFKINVEAGEVNSTTTGVMNSKFFTKFFNAWVEEFFRILLTDSQDEVAAFLKSLVVPPANSYLENVSIIELAAVAFGFAGTSESLPVCNPAK